MAEECLQAERYEMERPHLRAVAYRMLGSLTEADDALQEAWLRASTTDIADVRNIGGWLTTIVSRVCLNLLRARQARREESVDGAPVAQAGPEAIDPAAEAEMADEVGVALLVVMEALGPAERLAFVLHDLFAVSFDDIAVMLEKTPAAARQLASRARRRVRGAQPPAGPKPQGRKRQAVDAFLAATRAGDFEALVGLLHPDVVLTADPAVIPTPEPVVVLGAHTVAKGAMAAIGRAATTGVALLDGEFGLVMADGRGLRLVLRFTVKGESGLITEVEVIADRDALAGIDVTAP
ncbi:sigma-70 family RNA polymerase sigma factor [Streptomyces sp. SP18CS02]|uniref:sigma-70 family RNA polymerase sigma factor n=1 Tax=Streptomyces sp. SP18CS02 TaxID=3002531 RepID=UPI002E766520|nr:sigma-70 family RNA polymerase sigma factor [Streptomyces sp. SP18CS02]MEE1751253.1 sigma-70 family RNA polymerase sigma factor [Streptomyces sp. SP18CS02]